MQNPRESCKAWVIIPAAGVGSRMQTAQPKQYLSILGKTVIEHTLRCFSEIDFVAGIVVVISKNDGYWPALNIQLDKPIFVTEGGSERCISVLNGLRYLSNQVSDNDWILVHDAARPCLHLEDLIKMKNTLWQHQVGGLLGFPVADTLKFCDADNTVKRTVSRDGLWRAFTPQMFRFGLLLNAMQDAVQHPERVTDEASAMEMAGYEPVMVQGRWDNIKITHPQELQQAEKILQSFGVS